MNRNEPIKALKCLPHDDDSSSEEDRFSQGRKIILNEPNYTIQSAISEYRVSDIVAVVLAITRCNEVPSPKFASQSKIYYNILIGDQTLHPGKCVRVVVHVTSKNLASLFGVDGKESLCTFTPGKNDANDCNEYCDLGQLQPGDVVRFNNLEVHRNYEKESNPSPMDRERKQESISNEDDSCQTLLKISCELRASFKSLTAGPSVARLCRIIQKRRAKGDISDFQLQWERNVPISYETSKDVVLKLARYYSGSARTSQFTEPISNASSTTQPCQRRRIKDIISENTMSNVLVKVLRCERARSVFVTPSKSQTEQRITHATLADGHGNDDIIGISASVRLERVAGNTPVLPKGISATLLKAMSDGKFVLLTNVASRSVNPMATGKENLGLVPTSDTTATIVRPEHPYYLTPQKRSGKDAHTSQPLLSLTQDNSPEKKDSKCIMAIEAALIDIIVDGISTSLVEGAYWEKPRALSNFLIHRPSVSTGLDAIKLRPSYRTATLLLDTKVVSREVTINADSNALKLLCMDVPIEDMIVGDECNDVSTHPYLLHVGRMLRSLCEEDVRIRWVLEQEEESSWFVTNATLIEI